MLELALELARREKELTMNLKPFIFLVCMSIK